MPGALRGRLTVGRLTLDQVVKVRILAPQLRRKAKPGLRIFQIAKSGIALNANGVPDFHRLSSRLLNKRSGIAVTYFVFDVLAVEGLATTALPYVERRALLEQLDLEGPRM